MSVVSARIKSQIRRQTARTPRLLLQSLRTILVLIVCIGAVFGDDYLENVKPLLAHKCFACHGALKQQGGLRVDTAASLMTGGDSGPVVIPGQPSDSLLMQVVTGEAGFRMPPENDGAQLTDDEIAVIRSWIAQGAIAPESEQPQNDPRAWWSYQPIVRPDKPQVAETNWCRSGIDRFVAAKREQQSFPHVDPAEREVWLRRVYLDLIGLPPTRDELHRFLADESPSAYESIVDDLLSRPQYGERWARHWMDVWRYSDWYGSRGINEIRYSQRHIWRWRDWIVASLNADKGYDQMIREMLAADEIAGDDPAILPATGYLGRSWYKFDRDVWLFETVERTGEAFLGLTLRCCRCHDHKFDPVTQEEYYRFRAIFEPHDVRTDPISVLTGTQKDATLGQVLNDGIALVYDKHSDAPTYLFERGDSRSPDKTNPLTPGVPASLGGELHVQPVTLALSGWYPSMRAGVRDSLLEQSNTRISDAVLAVQTAEAARNGAAETLAAWKERPTESTRKRVVLDDTFDTLERNLQTEQRGLQVAKAELAAARAEAASVKARLAAEDARAAVGNSDEIANVVADAVGAEQLAAVARAMVLVVKAAGNEAELKKATAALKSAEALAQTPPSDFTPLGDQYPKTSTGRRRALADWITASENPRTARVAANHIWARHFGVPLVATPENFGLNGRKPTHPKLLDWLASELIENDWRMKPLHRQLVLSETYRMATTGSGPDYQTAAERDSSNALYWRMNSRRMEAEVVRDATLYVSGQLDPALGGPELAESKGEESHRRSLYFRNTPNESMPMLAVFDIADPNACYRRKESVVPHQSLAMMNSGLTQDAARIVARQLKDEPDFVLAAFETVLCRKPSAEETRRCEQFLAEHIATLNHADHQAFASGGTSTTQPSDDPLLHAQENLVLVLLLHNDFVTIR
jgi:Protein of unknown function (DUF1553)/Protein of unknown function (DUF1549)/Planctomycete cytochrome C